MHADVRSYLDAYKLTSSTREFVSKRQAMFIDGKWTRDADDSIDVIEPSTERLLTQLPAGTAAHVDRAVKAARREFDGGSWSKLRPLERERLIIKLADLLEANAQELAELESINVGKSVSIALAADVTASVDTLRYFAGWASKIEGRHVAAAALPGTRVAFTRKEPVGVVGCIIPWNFPLNTLSWKLGAALATGCTVVVKPSELTSFTALRLAELAQQAGVPDGVINVVTGTGDVAGAALTAHRGINKITFTGSTRTGRSVAHAAADHVTRVTLELGGKSPVIVLADADLGKAVAAIADGIFFNSGQACDAGSRAYVHEAIYEPFLKQLTEYAAGLPIAPGLDPNCFIGPLVSERQLTTVLRYIESGKGAGARLVCGGERLPRRGYFVPPTVFADCRNDMQIVREEIFGPVLTVAKFSTLSQAVELANDTDYGLAAAIYSNDLSAVHTLIPQLRSGTIYVNQHATLDPALPFGGYKQSGYGKDMGPEQLESFLETKAVWITLL
jgi:phenylacetaldehyde dehydrogenase